MANILLLANINCDRILQLDKPLQTGGRFHYQDGGLRLGGGGANTGLGLVWAKHNVSLVSEVGSDDIGDWILAKASTLGLDCRLVHRFSGNTCEMLLVMTPDGERTIIRPQRPIFDLPAAPNWRQWDAFYINSSANGAERWAQDALATNPDCIVVAQLAKDQRQRPCQVLIASITDMQGRCNQDPWQFAQTIAGNALKHFIVTDGDNGAIVYSADGQQHVPAVLAEVVDTTGAGDAFAAGVIHGLCQNRPITAAMQEGALWASFAVSTQSSIPGDKLQNYLA
ncbi:MULTISPECIES: PfkB family carbohydrate kinase [Shewanella]|jgi:site-specific DNA-methyltransferase (adenine-specific)|uniref:PfkB family carbohydrate kinase n=1 Tax=Shewanella TaxID=22 RepID=UPI00200FC3DF|nr:PfkB family carbohydrate kinase [Shewanella basaltis]MCL1115035.1 PfkB family carbohydrate kinase [Shewanella basaltis]